MLIDPALLALSHQIPADSTLLDVPGPSVSQKVNSGTGIDEPTNLVVSSSTCGPTRTTTSVRSSRACAAKTIPHTSTTARTVSQRPGKVGYRSWSLVQLKGTCRERQLHVSGAKAVLISRLEDDDVEKGVPTSSSPGALTSGSTASGTHPNAVALPRHAALDPEQAERDAALLSGAFEQAVAGDEDEDMGIDEDDDEGLSEDDEEKEARGDHDRMEVDDPPGTRAADARAWVDEYILHSRRKNGRQTEESVLRLWKRWLVGAVASNAVPDVIVDAGHIMEYLKYAATRKLFNKTGGERETDQRLSAASLKKIFTMLGRVRRRQVDDDPSLDRTRPAMTSRCADFYKAVMVESQRLRLEHEDFDVTKNTILDSHLYPEHFSQIKYSILTNVKQFPSMIKAHFSWVWQCTTLNRGDELANLLLSCIQPHQLAIPDFRTCKGQNFGRCRSVFGVLSMYHETKIPKPGKNEPDYNFVLPHRDPLRCPVGALALLLHLMFDQEHLYSRVDGWDWSRASSWRKVHLMFGKTVEKPTTPEGLRKLYENFLKHTMITSSKKLHLARRTMPTIMEDMGVSMDQVDAIGHWAGNVRREIYADKIPKNAVIALAGFFVGEAYRVPWAEVPVPDELQIEIFPFVEDALSRLRTQVPGKTNQGTVNFLELLQRLRPFFWRVLACIREEFPQCIIVDGLRVAHCAKARLFFEQWPAARAAAEEAVTSAREIADGFHDEAIQSAFMSMSARQKDLEEAIQSQAVQLRVIVRRTEPFSPTKGKPPRPLSRTPAAAASAVSSPRASSPPASSPADCSCGHTCRLRADARSESLAPPSGLGAAQGAGDTSTPTAAPSAPLPQLEARQATWSLRPPPPGLDPSRPHLPVDSQHEHHEHRRREHVPVLIHHVGRTLYVLPLSPPLRTPFDLILPPPAAFCSGATPAPAPFPSFDTAHCTWQAIFKLISRPDLLWDCWGPRSLGAYPDIKTLWEAWDEGASVKGVGRAPPLRLVESEWGRHEDRRTGKGKLPAWRPRKNANARQRWSQYMAIVNRVEDEMANGRTASAAVEHLDSLRDGRTLPQLQVALRPKGRRSEKKGGGAAATPSSLPPPLPSLSGH